MRMRQLIRMLCMTLQLVHLMHLGVWRWLTDDSRLVLLVMRSSLRRCNCQWLLLRWLGRLLSLLKVVGNHVEASRIVGSVVAQKL